MVTGKRMQRLVAMPNPGAAKFPSDALRTDALGEHHETSSHTDDA